MSVLLRNNQEQEIEVSEKGQLPLMALDEFTLPISVFSFEVPDAVWPTDNEFEIPLLDENLQATAVDLPFVGWGSVKRKKRMTGSWHFYVDDYRFTGVWKNPAEVVNTFAVNAVEPNFSVYNQMPLPVALWAIYRKRWVARWWQSRGVKIFVDLNVATQYADLNLMGVPKGWKAYATRGYSKQLADTEREFELACKQAGTKSILFVVYGGGRAVMEHCRQRGYLWFDETMNERKAQVING